MMHDNTIFALAKDKGILINNIQCKLVRKVADLNNSPIKIFNFNDRLAMIAERKIYLLVDGFKIDTDGYKTCNNIKCIRDFHFSIDGDIVVVHGERLELEPKTDNVLNIFKCYTHTGLIIMGTKEKANKISEEDELITVDIMRIRNNGYYHHY